MENKIILSTEALTELQNSYQWYESRSTGLGSLFVEFIERAINLILLNPEGYPNKKGSYREIVLRKFPYIIVYEFLKEDRKIYILHVFHTKRNQKYKYNRK